MFLSLLECQVHVVLMAGNALLWPVLVCDCANFPQKDHLQGPRAFVLTFQKNLPGKLFWQAYSLRSVHVHINPHFRILFNKNKQNTIHFFPYYYSPLISVCGRHTSSQALWVNVLRIFLPLCSPSHWADLYLFIYNIIWQMLSLVLSRKIFTTLFLRDLAPYLSYHKQLVGNACLLKNKLSPSIL